MPAEERALTSGELSKMARSWWLALSLKTPSRTGAAGDCCVEGRRRVTYRAEVVRGWLLPVCLTVKPVGEPDALIGHVRFDERGWETERRRMAQATAPILDSTLASFPARALNGRHRCI